MVAALEKKSSDKERERGREVGREGGRRLGEGGTQELSFLSCMFIFRVITNEVNLNRMKLILLSAGKSSSALSRPISSFKPLLSCDFVHACHDPMCLDARVYMCVCARAVTMDPNGRAIHLELLPRSRAYTGRNWNQCPPVVVHPRDGGDFLDDGVSRIKTITFTFVNVADGNEDSPYAL